jgi:hypothetical protein
MSYSLSEVTELELRASTGVLHLAVICFSNGRRYFKSKM